MILKVNGKNVAGLSLLMGKNAAGLQVNGEECGSGEIPVGYCPREFPHNPKIPRYSGWRSHQGALLHHNAGDVTGWRGADPADEGRAGPGTVGTRTTERCRTTTRTA